jgi:hypothetical protein
MVDRQRTEIINSDTGDSGSGLGDHALSSGSCGKCRSARELRGMAQYELHGLARVVMREVSDSRGQAGGKDL